MVHQSLGFICVHTVLHTVVVNVVTNHQSLGLLCVYIVLQTVVVKVVTNHGTSISRLNLWLRRPSYKQWHVEVW